MSDQRHTQLGLRNGGFAHLRPPSDGVGEIFGELWHSFPPLRSVESTVRARIWIGNHQPSASHLLVYREQSKGHLLWSLGSALVVFVEDGYAVVHCSGVQVKIPPFNYPHFYSSPCSTPPVSSHKFSLRLPQTRPLDSSSVGENIYNNARKSTRVDLSENDNKSFQCLWIRSPVFGRAYTERLILRRPQFNQVDYSSLRYLRQ